MAAVGSLDQPVPCAGSIAWSADVVGRSGAVGEDGPNEAHEVVERKSRRALRRVDLAGEVVEIDGDDDLASRPGGGLRLVGSPHVVIIDEPGRVDNGLAARFSAPALCSAVRYALCGTGRVSPMAVYALGDDEPAIDPTAFVHPEATIIGAVVVGPEASIWPHAVLRGDGGSIHVGARTSVQDGAVVNPGPGADTSIGDDCVIGHLASVASCRIDSGALVGSRAVILDGAHVESGAFVGAGAVVLGSVVVPSDALAVGVPAIIREGAARQDIIARNVERYVDRSHRYPNDLRQI